MSKVSQALSQILDQFKTGQIPAAVAVSCFPTLDVPSANWSFCNRIIMFCNQTDDARGFKQWKHVGRFPKKGAKAFYILAPLFKKEEKEGKKAEVIKGFKPVPVFRLQDTDGEALFKEALKLPDLPLMEKAEEWGIDVVAVPGNNKYYGYYASKAFKIALATDDESTFFHELIHCSEDRLLGGLKKGQDPLQEIVAELGASALCLIAGKQPSKKVGNSYRYIETYAKKLDLTPYKACLEVLNRTERAINNILN